MGSRYFGVTAGSGSVFEIYRCPANGRSLFKQADAEIERISPGGAWERVGLRNLILEEASGWFTEASDEISEEDALALIRTWNEGRPPADGNREDPGRGG